MKAPRSFTPTMMALTFIASLVLGGAHQAAVTTAHHAGHKLTVKVASDPVDPSMQGLALVDEGPGGLSTTDIIPSSWDRTLDKEPSIALDPFNGQPVVVWSRQEGVEFEIAMVRRLPGGWGPIDILTHSGTSNASPRVMVDAAARAHIMWYPTGLGGPVYLQSFDVQNGRPLGPPQRPFQSPSQAKGKNRTTGGDQIGGGDDPGLIGGHSVRASANPCQSNPTAAPEHGVVMACGGPAAYQLSSCRLVVGVYDSATSAWVQSTTDLSRKDPAPTSVRGIAQSIADARCN